MTRRKKRIRWTEAVPSDNRVNVPEDIIHDILLLLPIRSLLTCTAVCKSWRSLIQSSAFIHTRLNRTIIQSKKQNDDGQLLLINYYSDREKARIFSLHWDSSPSFSEYSKLLNPFETAYNQIKESHKKKYCCEEVVGTCNGLVCLHGYTSTLIWNPCIRKFVILPPPSVVNLTEVKVTWNPNKYKSSYAFGYDSLTNDYKVLRSVSSYLGFRRAVEIWSLSSGSWKRLSDDVVPAKFSLGEFTQRHAAFLNGVLHWIHGDEENSFIVSFDLSTELFGKILMPKTAVRRSKKSYATHLVYVRKEVSDLSRYRDSLAFFERRHKNMDCVRVHMWVMKEYGVAGSWAKLFTISPQEVVVGPLGFRKSGQVVLALHRGGRDGQFCRSMDPNTKQFEDFRVEGSCTKSYLFMDSFVESIVLLDQPNAISY
ncbi:hypothetical protein PRUPE_6G287700 [Prunus persica]|uniref:Uncharacterized protein n=1 Tax=Prunus persica TaxID=3760 RepID=M5WEG1_PRUPE|nr:F-box protein CPR30 [Prunus persica]ONI03873.1 hypothetical protein PRUPE_6G287700 [Prunus persica]